MIKQGTNIDPLQSVSVEYRSRVDMEIVHKVIDIIEKYRSNLNLAILKFQFPEQEQYQSTIAASHFLRLIDRNVKSILHICQVDLTLFPAAVSLSRTVIEIATNTIWLLEPPSYIERENRLIALLDEETSALDKYIRNIEVLESPSHPDILKVKKDKEKLNSYRQKIKDNLSGSYKEVKKKKQFEQLLHELELTNIYPFYRIASAFVHGRHSVTWLYKRQLDTPGFGERIDITDWYSPLFVCGWSIATVGRKYIQLYNPQSDFLSIDFEGEMIQKINMLRND